MLRRLLLAAMLAALAVPAWACADIPVNARIIEGSHFRVVALPDPAPIPLNMPFALDIRICDARMAEVPRLTLVDAQMPAHRHGMNYTPKVTKQDWGVYRAEGLLLHMPGEWEFIFEFTGADRPERLTFRIDAQ
jgi:hypothetical protein